MARPLLGDKPLTATEKNRRYRQKLRGIAEPTQQSGEPNAEELLRREILALRSENDRLRAVAGLTARATPEDVPAAVVPAAPSHSASAADIMAEYANKGPPANIWETVQRAQRMRAAGIPL